MTRAARPCMCPHTTIYAARARIRGDSRARNAAATSRCARQQRQHCAALGMCAEARTRCRCVCVCVRVLRQDICMYVSAYYYITTIQVPSYYYICAVSLLRAHASALAADRTGFLPLHYAARSGSAEAANVLLAYADAAQLRTRTLNRQYAHELAANSPDCGAQLAADLRRCMT